jgi:transcription termination/antitermination protein NusG
MNESPTSPSNEDAVPQSLEELASQPETPDDVVVPEVPEEPEASEADVIEEELPEPTELLERSPDEPTFDRDLHDDEPTPPAEEVALHEEPETPRPDAEPVGFEAAEDVQAPTTDDEIEEAQVEEEELEEAERPEQVAEAETELEAELAPDVELAPDAEATEATDVDGQLAADVEEALGAEGPVEAVVELEPQPAPGASDPFRGPGEWYVVHTYAGYENKVKTNLESRIHTMQMEDKIFAVHIPMEDVMEIKGGKKQVVQRKIFPGYLLVKMIYDNDSWYVVRNTPGVTGFVAAGTGSKPTPLSKREVEKILVVKKEEVKPTFRLGFEEEDVVRIISGPFADFTGTISEINVDQSKLKVLVNIFDRETPVELSFDQVAKV